MPGCMRRMELVTGATGYVGEPARAPPGAARAGPSARSRAGPSASSRSTASRRSRGDLLDGAGLERGARRLPAPPTTSSTRWRRARTAPSFADRDRRAAEALRAAPRHAPASSGSSTSAGSRRPARASRPPGLAARGRADPARRRARLDRAAGLDRDRRRLVLVPRARAPGRAAARAADSRPGASNRTQPIAERDVIEFLARTPAVPRGGGPLARRRRPGRADLRRDDRADRRGDGRRPRCRSASARSLTPPASAVVAARDRPAARARAPADGEPRVRHPAARRRRGAAPVRHPPAALRPRGRARARASGSRASALGAR